MTDWSTAFDGVARDLKDKGGARQPATLGEAWDAEWKANGLDTSFGVNRPFMDAYQELFDRTAEVTGRDIGELARERGMSMSVGGMPAKIDALGKIVDSLPEQQGKLLADYKDVYGRARREAADIEREAADVRGSTYGLSGAAVSFAAGMARQAIDPVNLATGVIGFQGPAIGAGKAAISLWLGKEALAGAATQAVQEPYIATRRQELGLESDSFSNIIQAGLGQAGLSGLFRAGGAAFRALARKGRSVPGMENLAPGDIDAVAHVAERDAFVADAIGQTPEAHQRLQETQMMLDGLAPVDGAASRKTWTDSPMAGVQQVIRPDGSRLAVEYKVIERSQLKVSHDLDGNVNPAFPPELQPRDRSTASSRLWVTENAGKLDPELLGAAVRATDGAPLIGPDGIVESGNGRVLLLDAARRDHPERAAAYLDWLEANGFATEGMKDPVLVRRRVDEMTPEQRIDLSRESNRPATASYSAPERARQDARVMDDGLLTLWQGGDFSGPQNAAFIRAFAGQVLTPEERVAFISKKTGNLSKEGAQRVQASLVERGWQSEFVTRSITEEIGPDSLNIMRALMDTAPLAARLRSALEGGRVTASADVLKPILDAVELVQRARSSGQKLADIFDQIDLERGAVAPEVRRAAELFFNDEALTRAASRDVVSKRLTWAIGEAMTHSPDTLFGDGVTAGGILKAAYLATEDFDTMTRAKVLTEAVESAPAAPRPDAPRTEVQATKHQPDPRLERARTMLDEHGDDLMLKLDEADTTAEAGTSARALLTRLEEYRKAAAELSDCVVRSGGKTLMEAAE